MLATDPNENNSQVPKKTQYNANKEQGMTNHLWSPERLAKPALTPRRNHLSPASPNPPLSASVCRWRQLSPDPRRTPQYTSETVFLVVLRMALCYSVITVYIYIYIYILWTCIYSNPQIQYRFAFCPQTPWNHPIYHRNRFAWTQTKCLWGKLLWEILIAGMFVTSS